ncbi:MAG: alpha/beta fold hydrolase, partial [Enterobacteriaceae bacterium]
MKLNYRLTENSTASLSPIVTLHGLFGDLNNIGSLARALQKYATTLQVDLRNHGRSPHAAEMNYPLMAEDVAGLIEQLNLPPVTLIGHSIGGKTAMALTALIPQHIDRVIVLDIAPVTYHGRHHDEIFAALQSVIDQGISTRHDAEKVMNQLLDDKLVVQFLLKSFDQGSWRFNLSALLNNYEALMGWQALPPWPGPILFLKGEFSPYIKQADQEAVLRQFPAAQY